MPTYFSEKIQYEKWKLIISKHFCHQFLKSYSSYVYVVVAIACCNFFDQKKTIQKGFTPLYLGKNILVHKDTGYFALTYYLKTEKMSMIFPIKTLERAK